MRQRFHAVDDLLGKPPFARNRHAQAVIGGAEYLERGGVLLDIVLLDLAVDGLGLLVQVETDEQLAELLQQGAQEGLLVLLDVVVAGQVMRQQGAEQRGHRVIHQLVGLRLVLQVFEQHQ